MESKVNKKVALESIRMKAGNINRKEKRWKSFQITLNVALVMITLIFCLRGLINYDLIGSYSMKVLVKVPSETVDLGTIAETYMPELSRDKGIEKVMRINHYRSRALVLLKGDEFYAPMHVGSRIPPENILLSTIKRKETNEKLFVQLGIKKVAKLKDDKLQKQ